MSTLAEVRLWGATIGAVTLEDDDWVASFGYTPEFAADGVELSPLRMPLTPKPYRFPRLREESFSGLPGLLADSLPDRFGNTLIDAWLATQGREPGDLNPVERLCYVGRRGMGALEFAPSIGPRPAASHMIDVAALAELAAEVLAARQDLVVSLQGSEKQAAMREILRVGTSAGGARAKALIAFDPDSREVRSGQLDAPSGLDQWILKFDGVDDESRELGRSNGYGAVEWVYSEIARDAGIEMSECDLLEEGERRHFITRRFDRGPEGEKLHMQSLAALAHLDYELAGAHSYEQAFHVIRRLRLPFEARQQQFRRMVFNVVARNQDDHVKNIAFLMDRQGIWSLSPAFDVVYAYNPQGRQTRHHQMSINGRVDGFTVEDLRAVGEIAGLKRGEAKRILAEVTEAVAAWPERAAEAGLEQERIERIRRAHRLKLPRR